MRFTISSFQNYINELGKKVSSKELLCPLLLNNDTLVFPYKDLDEALIISLNHKDPFIGISPAHYFYKLNSFDNESFRNMREYLNRTYIETIKPYKDDFGVILKIKNEEFPKLKELKIDLFPLVPNLYLIDEKGQEVHSFYKKVENKKPEFSLKGEECNFEIISRLIERERERRIEQKYDYFLTILKRRIDRILKKKKYIDDDLEKGKANLVMMDYVNSIYTLNLDLKKHVDHIDCYGEIITLDPALSIKENIDKFVNLYKKGKRTIEVANENYKRYETELAYYTNIRETFFRAETEKEKDKIVFDSGLISSSHPTALTPFNMPYKINHNGVIYYFGKNAAQNDYVSFIKKFDREFVWFHAKDVSGAHVIICKKKPSEKELIFGAEIALICSKLTTGYVTYALKKNVRKGHKQGEAILKNYSVMKLNVIDDKTYEYVKNATRSDN